MKIVQVKCPACGQPIYQKNTDEMLLCQNCGAIHRRNAEGPYLVPYEIASPAPGPPGQRYYLPFWRLVCQVTIRSRDVEGDWMHKLTSRGNGGGMLTVFVPASDVDTATFRRLAVTLTTSPPRYMPRKDFDLPRMPTTMGQREAAEMAEFVVVTLEAEKPGTLQYLDYDLKVTESKLIYLPFINTPSGPWLSL